MYKKEHYIGAALTFLAVLVVYIMTMAPTVTFWDAGEFIAAAHTLGVPHPPGTPLFVIVGRVLSLIPLPFIVAAKLNFLSVICGATAAMLLYLIGVKITENMVEEEDRESFSGRLVIHGGAVICGLIPSFFQTVWSNATEFEVYAIATLTIILVGWLMVYMGELKDAAREQKVLLLVVYLVGLSIANHLIVVLVAPAVILYTVLHDKRNWKFWLSVLTCFAGLYVLVMKGISLSSFFNSMSQEKFIAGGLIASFLRNTGEFFIELFHLLNHIDNWTATVVGAIITGVGIWWASRQKALGFFGVALFLFLLGFSIHLYLLIRSGLNPPINEGQPDTLGAFWAVIGREQYGSAYGFFPRQVWEMVNGKHTMTGPAELIDNIVYFFKYNIPFYNKYFFEQFGNPILAAVSIIVGIYGAFVHWRHERKSFYFWLAVFLITGPILNAYMNFKLGYSQFNDKFPDMNLHEVRERDYFFIVSFAFFGLWCGLGYIGIANRLRKAFSLNRENQSVPQPVWTVIVLALIAVSLLPFRANYYVVSRGGNYFPPEYARNIMNSMEEGGIIFTNGDNDTFPLWYIQEVENVRNDCRIINLSLLNTDWYIRQMRDMEPRVPISYTDEQIRELRPFMLDRKLTFKAGPMTIEFPKEYVMYNKDIMLLDIIRQNNWKRPIYFTTTVPTSNRTNLNAYLVQQGMVYRVMPEKAEVLAQSDSNYYQVNEIGICLDIKRTEELLYHVYDYSKFKVNEKSREDSDTRLMEHFAGPFSILGEAYANRGEMKKYIDAHMNARRFILDRHRYDPTTAKVVAQQTYYDTARAYMDSYEVYIDEKGIAQPTGTIYMQLAQIALNHNEADRAAGFLWQSVENNPDFMDGYANLVHFYNNTENPDGIKKVFEEYLKLYPEDTSTQQAYDTYRESGELKLDSAFNYRVQ